MTESTKSGGDGTIAELEPRHVVPIIIIGGLALVVGFAALLDGDWLVALPLITIGAAEMMGAAWVRRGRGRRRLLLTAANGLVAAALIAGTAVFDSGGWTWTRLAMACFSLMAILYAVREIVRFRLRGALEAGRLNATEAVAALARGDRLGTPVMGILGLIVVVVMLPQSRLIERVRNIFGGLQRPDSPVTTVEREIPGRALSELDEETILRALARKPVYETTSAGDGEPTAEELATMVLTVTPETFDEFMASHAARFTYSESDNSALVDDLPLSPTQVRHLVEVARIAGERRE